VRLLALNALLAPLPPPLSHTRREAPRLYTSRRLDALALEVVGGELVGDELARAVRVEVARHVVALRLHVRCRRRGQSLSKEEAEIRWHLRSTCQVIGETRKTNGPHLKLIIRYSF
jgi:hypothetical protein